jgi:exportin-2 (importin alpha re-exporter)
MLASYQASMDWKAKDAALHLVLSVAFKGASSNIGVGELNPLINILDIFQSHVLPELHDGDVNARPIVKADAIKLVCTFRSFFDAGFIVEILPHLIRHLSSQHVVIQTYAAFCIERFLVIKKRDDAGVSRSVITREHLLPALQPLFAGLFGVLSNPDLPENDYVMKCIMRVLYVVGREVTPVLGLILEQLTTALERVCKNPTNPQFNHFLFECVALLVKAACFIPENPAASAAGCEALEGVLFPPIQAILGTPVTEFMPYSFQILAQLLSSRPAGSALSQSYRVIFRPLLDAVLWESKGNVPALTDLICAYITVGMPEIIGELTPILGIFQKLLSAKVSQYRL